ncbi:AVAST type 1 anti-phage system MBL fold metallo-hydrolase Avs1a [Roseivirga pacifica]|uniref:AVAST type 1 anti-phage system MBL fold metallo-hydrolase Avs1a n=1 Tax=Roseivirga pacifica TaxID=1267423 RepID=UPI003BB0B7E4
MEPDITSKLIVYPSENGDSFLLKAGSVNLLIDGGYVNTYKNHIKGDLEEISRVGGELSLIVVTHIDQDHISGILKLFEENQAERLIKISRVWHNSYRHLQFEKEFGDREPTTKDDFLDEIKGSSYLKEVVESSNHTISAKHGSSLSAMLLSGSYSWNDEFENKAVSTENKLFIDLPNDVHIKLLSPNNEKLRRLDKEWHKELKRKGYLAGVNPTVYYDDAFEFMVARHKEKPRYREKNIASSIPDVENLAKGSFFEDRSPTNGSSIAFVLEYSGKKLLFLGDSHPSVVVQSLKSIYSSEKWPLQFDVIKLSHHGSWSNNSPELFTLIDAPKYIISTNGKGHGHPDEETIASVVSRESEYIRELYFNYPSEKATSFDVAELRERFRYSIIQGDGKSPIQIDLK